MDNAVGRGLLNGWQLSGISSLASGIPYRLGFAGAAGSATVSASYFGTADVVGPALSGGNGAGAGLHLRPDARAARTSARRS